jgi:hypothetical protein
MDWWLFAGALLSANRLRSLTMTFLIKDGLTFDACSEGEVCIGLKKVPCKELAALQPLGYQVLFERCQTVFDGLWLDGIAKADVTLALATEDHARDGGHMRFG